MIGKRVELRHDYGLFRSKSCGVVREVLGDGALMVAMDRSADCTAIEPPVVIGPVLPEHVELACHCP